MPAAPFPEDEAKRILALHALNMLDTLPEDRFDRVTRLATKIFDVPVALVSLVDTERQWFKSCQGLEISETPRTLSFCAHAILQDEAFIIPDARLDARFADNPVVTGEPHVVFYAGYPITLSDGSKMGTLCLLDYKPRNLSSEAIESLRDLAQIVIAEFRLNEIDRFEDEAFEGLKRSEQRLRLAVANSQVGVWDWDIVNESLYWSPELKAVLGYADDELDIDFETFAASLHPDDRNTTAALEAHLERGEPYDIEQRQRHKSGNYRWFRVRGQANFDDAGRPIRMVGTSVDITERKQIELALQDSNALLEEAQRIANLGIWTWDVPDNKVTWTDPLFEMFQVPKQPLISFETYENVIHPDDQTRVIGTIQTSMAGTDESYNLEHRVVLPTGAIRNVFIYGYIFRNEAGAPIRLIGVAQDITERERLEEALRTREQEFRSLAESSPDYILRYDTERRIRYLNTNMRNLLMLDGTHEVIGRRLFEAWPDGRFNAVDEALEQAMDSGNIVTLETASPSLTETEEMIYTETYIVPERDVNGDIIGANAFSRNITERKEAEATLAKQAAELRTVAKVSTQVAATLTEQDLLQSVVDLTKEQFGLYHAHIYLLDESSQILDLVTGAGEAGRKMVAQGQQITAEQEHSIVALAARNREAQIVNDVRATLGFLPNPLLPETRSELAVPLIVGGQVLGVLDVQSDRLNYFSEEDIYIQTALAAQVAVALQNARFFTQSKERAQELALTNRIVTQMNAIQDVKAALQFLVDELGVSMRADSAVVNLINADGTTHEIVAAYLQEGIPSPVGATMPLEGDPLMTQIMETQQTMAIDDVAVAPFLPQIRETLLQSGLRSLYTIPMFVGPELIGSASIGVLQGGEPLSPDQIRLAETLVFQAAYVVQSIRLYVQTGQYAEELAFINRVVTEMNASDTKAGLEFMVEELSRILQVPSVSIGLIDDSETMLEMIAAHHPVDSPAQGRVTIPVARDPVISRALQTRQTVVVEDVANSDLPPQVRETVLNFGVRSFYVIPMLAGSALVGTVALNVMEGGSPLTLEQLKLAETVVQQVSTAVQNARLFEQVQTAFRQVEQSGARLAEATTIAKLYYWELDLTTLMFTFDPEYYRFLGIEDDGVYKMSAEEYGDKYVHPDSAGIVAREVQAAIASPETDYYREIEDLNVTADGRVVPVLVRFRLIRDAQGNPIKTIGANQDITEQKKSEAALSQALAETDRLYHISQKLNQADNLQSLLNIVAEEGALPGVNRVVLTLFEYDEDGTMQAIRHAATWYSGSGPEPTPVGTRYERDAFASLQILLTTEPVFLDDINSDPRLDPDMRQILINLKMGSLVALPLWSGTHQLGVLLLQSETPYVYEDHQQNFLLAIAQQVAPRVQNQQLLTETQATLTELEALQKRYTLQAWQDYRLRQQTLGFEKVAESISPLNQDTALVAMDESLETELTSLTTEYKPTTKMRLPMRIRDEIIGVLGLEDPSQGQAWTEDEIALVEAIIEQMALAAENLRLFDEARERASREQTIRTVSEELRSAPNLDSLLDIAVEALGQHLAVDQAILELGLTKSQPTRPGSLSQNGNTPKA